MSAHVILNNGYRESVDAGPDTLLLWATRDHLNHDAQPLFPLEAA